MASRLIALIYVVFSFCGFANAEPIVADVAFDRWMYPFNASAGARPSGTTFGAIGNPQFDDRDAQIVVGFDTVKSGVPAGAGATNYQIESAKVLMTTATNEAISLDPTYDSWQTYLDPATDEDEGRPVELFGVGFRNGYASGGVGESVFGPPVFNETDGFGPPGPPVPADQTRNAFAADDHGDPPRDVSNNIRGEFDPHPWAVGNVTALAPGQAVPIDTALEFDVDLTNPDVVSYLQSGLNDGQLFFSVASMHTSVQGSDVGIPSFHLGTLDGASLGQRPQLQLDYTLVPEPTGMLLMISMAFVLMSRAIRNQA